MNNKQFLAIKCRRQARRAAGHTKMRPTKVHGSCRFHKEALEREALREAKDDVQTAAPDANSVSLVNSKPGDSAMSTPLTIEDIAAHIDSMTDAEMIARIRSLDISAQDKGLLRALMDAKTVIGGVMVRIGKKVLDLCLSALNILMANFPATMAGLLLGALLGIVFSAIPVLGWFLGPMVGPILMLGIGTLGLLKDLGGLALVQQRIVGVHAKILR